MLLSVLVISGTILGATTIAGLLMLYQLRQATNISFSQQALFAADAGIEWELFKLFKPEIASANPDLAPVMDNQTCVATVSSNQIIRSVGCAGGAPAVVCRPETCSRPVKRAFQVSLEPVE